ncbi:MAG: hypothetical protein WCG92_25130 [Hyphomicrobiales bacterium]
MPAENSAMERKAHMKSQRWINAYEDWNVDTGLACGLSGRAQSGKGMCAPPDRSSDMRAQTIAYSRAGAKCSWVLLSTTAIGSGIAFVKRAERPSRA